MVKREPRTVLELCIAVGGYRKGFRVATYIAQWTIAQDALGHEPTVEEAAGWWKESRRSWFRYQVEFREIFDLLDTPGPIAEAIIAERQERLSRKDSPATIAQLARIVPPAVPA